MVSTKSHIEAFWSSSTWKVPGPCARHWRPRDWARQMQTLSPQFQFLGGVTRQWANRSGGSRGMSTSVEGYRSPWTWRWVEAGQTTETQGDSRQSKTYVKAPGCTHPVCVMLKETSPNIFKCPFCLVHSNTDVRWILKQWECIVV